jgi:hypothetical protein
MSQILSRRQVIAGVSLLICTIPCGHSHAQGSDNGGCWVPNDKAESFFSRTTSARVFSNGHEDMEPRSGNPTLDRALAQGLATISRTFGVLPGFAYYQEERDVNAKATSEPLLNQTDGTVMFGLSLLRLLLTKDRPDASVLAVCAHEFGHIVSFKNGMISSLAPQRNAPFRAEQFADYMAGYYAGTRKLLNSSYPAVVFATTQNFFGGGDHGSGTQRGEAVEQGFLAAYQRRLNSEAGIQAAYDFAMQRSPDG